jgi:hypothetical protein
MNALVCRFFDFFSTFHHPIRVAVTDLLLTASAMAGSTYYILYWQTVNAPYGLVYHTNHLSVLGIMGGACFAVFCRSYGSAVRAAECQLVRHSWPTIIGTVCVVVGLTVVMTAAKVYVLHRDFTIYEVLLSLSQFGLAGAPFAYRSRLGLWRPRYNRA